MEAEYDADDQFIGWIVENHAGNGPAIEEQVQQIRAERGATADDYFARERERAEGARRSSV